MRALKQRRPPSLTDETVRMRKDKRRESLRKKIVAKF